MKKLFIIITIFFLSTNLYAAGGSSGGDGQESKQSNYKSAVNYVKAGKKLEKKGKIEKAKVKYEKAFKRLLKANDKDPSNPDVLNYLGFTSRKLGDFKSAENYYLSGLKINPKRGEKRESFFVKLGLVPFKAPLPVPSTVMPYCLIFVLTSS